MSGEEARYGASRCTGIGERGRAARLWWGAERLPAFSCFQLALLGWTTLQKPWECSLKTILLTACREHSMIGNKYSKLTVIASNGDAKWLCQCDCGATKAFHKSQLTSGHNKSCGCIVPRHGMRYHPAYKSWLHMKQRCTNPKNQDYHKYGGRGISVHPALAKIFPVWLAEIGERPEGERWSIGRIDNNKDYTYGNMRWEQDDQQARNHGLAVTNKTGHIGVIYRERITSSGSLHRCWIAQWAHELNKKKSKEFGCAKYGDDVARQLAIDYRAKMIAQLNAEGFEYADSHGKERIIKNDQRERT